MSFTAAMAENDENIQLIETESGVAATLAAFHHLPLSIRDILGTSSRPCTVSNFGKAEMSLLVSGAQTKPRTGVGAGLPDEVVLRCVAVRCVALR